MHYIFSIIFGILGGILAGSGMGGGTITIPLLTKFLHYDLRLAQSINLITFIPMSVVVLCLHFKHKLVVFSYFYVAIVALIFALLGGFLSHFVSTKFLSVAFGIFLTFLGAIKLFTAFHMKN